MTQHVTPSPANPNVADSDEALAAQPVGYWSSATMRAVLGHIRDAMARHDLSQPQWWALNRVDVPDRPTREEVIAQLAHAADGPREIARAVDQLLARGWLATDGDGRLLLTDAGREAKARIRQLVTELRAQIHEGISDEDYVTALKVMRRMIRNIEAA